MGMSPVMPIVKKLKQIQTIEELNQFLTLPAEERGDLGLVGYDVERGFGNSKEKIVWIGPVDLSLGDSAEYKQMTEAGKRSKKAADHLSYKLLK